MWTNFVRRLALFTSAIVAILTAIAMVATPIFIFQDPGDRLVEAFLWVTGSVVVGSVSVALVWGVAWVIGGAEVFAKTKVNINESQLSKG
ncbi:MAG: hypothetical protein ACREYC_17090 [Gammaproteobacteria bacterium]